MPPLALILAVIQAAPTVYPALKELIDLLKEGFSADDQATIDAALVAARAMSDAQHQEAQAL